MPGSVVPPAHEANDSGAVSPAPYSSMNMSIRGSSGPTRSSCRPQAVITTGASWSAYGDMIPLSGNWSASAATP